MGRRASICPALGWSDAAGCSNSPHGRTGSMDADDIPGDLTRTLFTEQQIRARLAELCRQIEADYEGRDLLLIGVLKGAIMVMSDLSRELRRDVEMDWMATSSYGASTESSGVVR